LQKYKKLFEYNAKKSSENFLPLPRNRKQTKIFHSVMMSVAQIKIRQTL